MIVWLNGPFGVGKTAVAEELVARSPGATLFDPETLGVVMQRLTPGGRARDFQDRAAWRRWTLRSLLVVSAVRKRLVVPMTIAEPAYFEEIVGALRRKREVRHFTLTAPAEVVRARLAARDNAGGWAEEQLLRCERNQAAAAFGDHVSTANRTPRQIAEEILARARAT